MSDELKARVRFRLLREPNNWVVKRSYVSKGDATKLPAEHWKTESYHPSLKIALKHMLERLYAEGYSPKGVAALVARVELAEERVLAFCKAHLPEDPEPVEAELEKIQ